MQGSIGVTSSQGIGRPGLWRIVLDNIEVPIIATTSTGAIVELNAAAERLLRYRESEVLGRVSLTSLHDEGEMLARARALSLELGVPVEPGFEALVARARSGLTEERRWTYLRKDATRASVSVSIKALFDTDGQVEGFLSVSRELAPLAQHQHESHQSQERCDASGPEPGRPRYGSACFDLGEALHRLGGNRALLTEVADLFEAERGSLLDAIRLAVADRNPRAIERGAHKLRGVLVNMAGRRAAEAALLVEQCARSEQIPALERLDALSSEFDRLSAALSPFRSVPPKP